MSFLRCIRPPNAEENCSSEEEVVDSSREFPKCPPPSPDQKEEEIPIAPRCFRFSELDAATNHFSKICLLDWGFLNCVYRGYLEDGQVVAVKKLHPDGENDEFPMQVDVVIQLNHPNIVNLIGYCADGDRRFLVYEFMPLGSLKYHLHDLQPKNMPLDWNTRMKIAEGVAQGLQYLHNMNPPFIYRFIKSTNILLGKGYHPKLSDIGFERFFPTYAKPTIGYIAPETLLEEKLSVESDVYSFGVLLLELVTGRKPIDHSRTPSELLVAWARPLFTSETKFKFSSMADPLLQGRFPLAGLYGALCLASHCLNNEQSRRPPIEHIVHEVSYLASQPYDPNSAPAQTPTPSSKKDGINQDGGSPDRKYTPCFSFKVGSSISKADGVSGLK